MEYVTLTPTEDFTLTNDAIVSLGVLNKFCLGTGGI